MLQPTPETLMVLIPKKEKDELLALRKLRNEVFAVMTARDSMTLAVFRGEMIKTLDYLEQEFPTTKKP